MNIETGREPTLEEILDEGKALMSFGEARERGGLARILIHMPSLPEDVASTKLCAEEDEIAEEFPELKCDGTMHLEVRTDHYPLPQFGVRVDYINVGLYACDSCDNIEPAPSHDDVFFRTRALIPDKLAEANVRMRAPASGELDQALFRK